MERSWSIGAYGAATTAALLAAGALVPVGCRDTPSAISSAVMAGAPGYELYQAHCAACHGHDGTGDGIAAVFLEAQPRDLRREPFRYVSSLDGTPTETDLAQTIRRGRTDGEMPAAPWLDDEEIRRLVAYVRELNRLGWVDRLREEYGDDPDTDAREIEEISEERVAPGTAISFGPPAHSFRANLDVGRDLYMQSCASCHGPSGRGDGLDKPLDELGRPISVRDLTGEPIRGGDDPIELFKRIRCGVPGTPMPSQPALSDEQVWQLVVYTRHLASRPLAW